MGELQQRSTGYAYLVFAVTEVGTTHVIGYGPDGLAEAQAMAKRLQNGIVVQVPVVADS